MHFQFTCSHQLQPGPNCLGSKILLQLQIDLIKDTEKERRNMPQSIGSLVFVLFISASYLVLMVNCISLPSPVKTFANDVDTDQQQSLQMSIAKACEVLAYRNLADLMRSSNSPVESFPSNIRQDKRSAMGIDLPDFLLNYNGKVPITGSYREKMERNGR